MLCVDCLYIYFPLISQIITGIYFPQISLIIIGVYFPLISQINTDLNNILSFTLYTLHLPPLSVFIRTIRGSYITFLYTLHLTPYTTIRVHPCHPWEIISPSFTPYTLHLTPRGAFNQHDLIFSPILSLPSPAPLSRQSRIAAVSVPLAIPVCRLRRDS